MAEKIKHLETNYIKQSELNFIIILNNDDEVKKEIEILYNNLASHNIDGKRYVIDHIKRPIRDYAECYNLKGVTTRITSL